VTPQSACQFQGELLQSLESEEAAPWDRARGGPPSEALEALESEEVSPWDRPRGGPPSEALESEEASPWDPLEEEEEALEEEEEEEDPLVAVRARAHARNNISHCPGCKATLEACSIAMPCAGCVLVTAADGECTRLIETPCACRGMSREEAGRLGSAPCYLTEAQRQRAAEVWDSLGWRSEHLGADAPPRMLDAESDETAMACGVAEAAERCEQLGAALRARPPAPTVLAPEEQGAAVAPARTRRWKGRRVAHVWGA
jgi:hypothetical protein